MIKQKIKNYVLGVCRASHEASKLSRTLSNTQRNKILNSIDRFNWNKCFKIFESSILRLT